MHKFTISADIFEDMIPLFFIPKCTLNLTQSTVDDAFRISGPKKSLDNGYVTYVVSIPVPKSLDDDMDSKVI